MAERYTFLSNMSLIGLIYDLCDPRTLELLISWCAKFLLLKKSFFHIRQIRNICLYFKSHSVLDFSQIYDFTFQIFSKILIKVFIGMIDSKKKKKSFGFVALTYYQVTKKSRVGQSCGSMTDGTKVRAKSGGWRIVRGTFFTHLSPLVSCVCESVSGFMLTVLAWASARSDFVAFSFSQRLLILKFRLMIFFLLLLLFCYLVARFGCLKGFNVATNNHEYYFTLN